MLPDLSSPLIPRPLAPLLSRALSLDLERRPSSANQLMAWLREADRAGALEPASTAYAPTERVESASGPWKAATAAALDASTQTSSPMPREALRPVFAASAQLERAAPVPPTEPRLPGPRRRARAGLVVSLCAAAAVGVGALIYTRRGPAEDAAPAGPAASSDAATSPAPPSPAPTPPAPAPTSPEVTSATAEPTPSARPIPSLVPSARRPTTSSTTEPTTAPAPASPAGASKTCAAYVALM